MLVDSHCHLNSSEIIDRIDEVVRNAQINGIELLQTISTKISQHEELLKIVERQEKVFCSVGNHPLNLQSEGIVHHQDIVRLCSHEKVTSIGETGLDYLS
jgi:TatD DNase family protein